MSPDQSLAFQLHVKMPYIIAPWTSGIHPSNTVSTPPARLATLCWQVMRTELAAYAYVAGTRPNLDPDWSTWKRPDLAWSWQQPPCRCDLGASLVVQTRSWQPARVPCTPETCWTKVNASRLARWWTNLLQTEVGRGLWMSAKGSAAKVSLPA